MLLALPLCACREDQTYRPEREMPAAPLSAAPESAASTRFEIRLEQMVADEIAYGDRRGVYVILDRQTGREYVGISGVGIAELGAHEVKRRNGAKVETEIVPDER